MDNVYSQSPYSRRKCYELVSRSDYRRQLANRTGGLSLVTALLIGLLMMAAAIQMPSEVTTTDLQPLIIN